MIKKCLFPAAGYGTRFLPATKSMPKEMMPIVSKPLIEYGVEEALEAGMSDICIVTGRGKRALEDHFDANYELEHQISGSAKEELLWVFARLSMNATSSYTRQREMKALGMLIFDRTDAGRRSSHWCRSRDDLCHHTDGVGVLSHN